MADVSFPAPNVVVPDRGRVLRYVAAVALAGLSAGLVGALLTAVFDLTRWLIWGASDRAGMLAATSAAAPLRLILVLAAAGLLGAVVWWALDTRGHTPVPLTKGVAAGAMPLGRTAVHALLQVVLVGFGASIGKEVAPRELSAAVGGWVAARLGLTATERRVVMAAAAGAGLGAVYSVPVSGTLFALEVLLKEVRLRTVVTAALVSALATAVMHAFGGGLPYYEGLGVMRSGWSLLLWAALIGPLLGVAGRGFSRLQHMLAHWTPRGAWRLLVMPIVFAGVGAIAIAVPRVLGNGEAVAQLGFSLAEAGRVSATVVPLLVMLAASKTITTLASLGAGAWGGTLTPSVAVGGALGLAAGALWVLIVPGASLPACVFIGAAAFLATTMRAPLTALMLMLEFTHQGVPILGAGLLAIVGAIGVNLALDRRNRRRSQRIG